MHKSYFLILYDHYDCCADLQINQIRALSHSSPADRYSLSHLRRYYICQTELTCYSLSIPPSLSLADRRRADAAGGASVVGTVREREVMQWESRVNTSGDWRHLLDKTCITPRFKELIEGNWFGFADRIGSENAAIRRDARAVRSEPESAITSV